MRHNSHAARLLHPSPIDQNRHLLQAAQCFHNRAKRGFILIIRRLEQVMLGEAEHNADGGDLILWCLAVG